jgi:Gpi18-like mannosyltransferase
MKRSELGFIFLAFIIWRLTLQFVLMFSVKFVTLQEHFLGGDLANYLSNPLFWAWGNFDGQHYVNIAKNGYGFGEHTFFPLYPFLIKLIAGFIGASVKSYHLSGQIISNLSFLVGLIGFYKLARLDHSDKIAKLSVIFLLVFPTSFYFAAVYTESLFLALLTWSFYFFIKKKYFCASVLGLALTALRPVGIFLFPAFWIDWLMQKDNKRTLISFSLSSLIIPSGLLGYMYYLKVKVNDMFAFFSNQVYVGEHRSRQIILIPQILYRYVFKVLPNLNYSYFPGVFFTFLELGTGILYLLIVVTLFWTFRVGYAVFSALAYITPTFLGSFSSEPRYVLIIFPAYFLAAKYLSRNRFLLFAFLAVSFILLLVSFSLYSRGYWLS